ncbi:hypothetical protein ACFLQ2_00255 [archaeon]
MAKKTTKKKTTKKPVKHAPTHKAKPSSAVSFAKTKVTPSMWNWAIVIVAAIVIIGMAATAAKLASGSGTSIIEVPKIVYLDGATGSMTDSEVIEISEEFIAQNLVPPGVTAKVTSVEEESGVYKLDIILSSDAGDDEVVGYLTKDGKLFFYGVAEVEESPEAQAPQAPETPQTASFDAPDMAVPEVEFFVMSFCPYGQQAEKGLEPVYQLLGDSVDWTPHFVIYENYRGGGEDYCIDDGNLCAMHGIDELNENIRQACIARDYDSSTLWEYLKYVYDNCQLSDINTCWLDAAEDANVDSDAVSTCQEEDGVALMAAERALNVEKDVSGSPAVFVNGVKHNGGRAPEDYKTSICTGFTNTPEACAESIGTATGSASGSC